TASTTSAPAGVAMTAVSSFAATSPEFTSVILYSACRPTTICGGPWMFEAMTGCFDVNRTPCFGGPAADGWPGAAWGASAATADAAGFVGTARIGLAGAASAAGWGSAAAPNDSAASSAAADGVA